MMLFISTVLLSWVCSALLRDMVPWYTFVAACGLCGFLLGRSGRQSFWLPFVGLLLLWGLTALGIHWLSDYRLGTRMASLLGLPHHMLIVAVTGVLGALLGGLGSWSGYRLRRAF
jgi:hypothetical protein